MTKKKKPILLLDCDGVVNVLDKNNVELEFHHILDGWNIYCSLAKGTTQKLLELNNLYDVYWCSGHNEKTNQINKTLKIPRFKVCKIDLDAYELFKHPKELNLESHLVEHWKLLSIDQFLTENNDNRPLVFIDDEMSAEKFALKRSETGARTIFVKTNGQLGLTEDIMLVLRQFANYNSNGDLSNESNEITKETE